MRGKGEGALYKRASDGLWVATVELTPRDGKRRRRVVTGRTKAIVVAKLRAEQEKTGHTRNRPTTTQTLGDWLAYWLENIAAPEVRPTTFASYAGVVRLHIAPEIGYIRLDKLEADDVRRVHRRILGLGLSASYALLAHRVLNVALNAAVEEHRIGVNPFATVKAPRKPKPSLETLDLEESIHVLQTMHTALQQTPYDPYPARWTTALLTAGRRGEIIGLELDRVTDTLDLSWQLQRLSPTATPPADFERRHLTGQLYLTRPKSTAGWRIIPLVDPLKSVLAAHQARMTPNPWGLLFTTKAGQPIDPRADTRAWADTLARLGIDKHVRLHDIRHSTVDLLYEAGVPEAIIMEIVGHSTRMMTRSYKSRGNLAQLTAALESMSALLTRPQAAVAAPLTE